MCLFVHSIGKHVINTLGLNPLVTASDLLCLFCRQQNRKHKLIFYVYFAVISSSEEDAKYQCYTLCDINKLLDREYLVEVFVVTKHLFTFVLFSDKIQKHLMLNERHSLASLRNDKHFFNFSSARFRPWKVLHFVTRSTVCAEREWKRAVV